MSDLVLSTAIGNYGHTKPLKDGSLKSSRFELEHVEISPVPMIFRRMVRGLEFDVAEMALAAGAVDLGADHEERPIGLGADGVLGVQQRVEMSAGHV